MSKVDLSDNTRAVQSFRRAIEFCTLPHVPQTTRQVLSTEAWRDRFEMGRRIQFNDFVEFVTQAPAKGGCGLKPEKVTELLRKAGDEDALKMWLQAIRAKQTQQINVTTPKLQAGKGRPVKGSTEKDDRTFNRGTTAAYAIARLRRDRPDIHARVLAGELTPNAGMIEAGFRKKRESKKLTPLERIERLLPKLTDAEFQHLLRVLEATNDLHLRMLRGDAA
jgi:hypothetical protein